LRIDLGYEGTRFHGWAKQPNLRTVQGELEAALHIALREVSPGVTCAGRTDAGVHARGQVVHCDVEEDLLVQVAGRAKDPFASLERRLNGILPLDVRVRGVAKAPAAFDARFAALSRRYIYRIADLASARDPLTRNHVLQWQRPLNVADMNSAARLFIGEHDFAAFCKQRPGATTIRRIFHFDCTRQPSHIIEVSVSADAFCHHMVRLLVGCLVAVGEGRRQADWAAVVLAGRSRCSDVLMLPPAGLTLEEVCYPHASDLAARVTQARSLRLAGPL
jgi:tRNA pseudouridine38-40 synthase